MVWVPSGRGIKRDGKIVGIWLGLPVAEVGSALGINVGLFDVGIEDGILDVGGLVGIAVIGDVVGK